MREQEENDMEASERSVSEYNEQVKDDHLTELQRKVFEALRQMNVHRYCPGVNQIAQKTELNTDTTKAVLMELCKLGIVIWRIDASTGDESYRLCKPEEFIRKERLAAKKGESVSPNQGPSSTGTVSPKVEPKVQPKTLSCPKCGFVAKNYAGLHIHVGQTHKTAADIRDKIKLQELKAKKKVIRSPPDPPANAVPFVTITLTVDEALDASIALALVELISTDGILRPGIVERFKDAHKISEKLLRAVIKQAPQEDIEGAS